MVRLAISFGQSVNLSPEKRSMLFRYFVAEKTETQISLETNHASNRHPTIQSHVDMVMFKVNIIVN